MCGKKIEGKKFSYPFIKTETFSSDKDIKTEPFSYDKDIKTEPFSYDKDIKINVWHLYTCTLYSKVRVFLAQKDIHCFKKSNVFRS